MKTDTGKEGEDTDRKNMTALSVSSDLQNAIRHHKSGIKQRRVKSDIPFYLSLLGKSEVWEARFYKTVGLNTSPQPHNGETAATRQARSPVLTSER